MAGILVYSERWDLALELLSAANLIAESTGDAVSALSINDDALPAVLADAGAVVYNVINPSIKLFDAAAVAPVLIQTADDLGIDTILLSSDRRGKELAGRAAQRFKAGCLTDVAALGVEDGTIVCQRSTLGGATVARQYIATQHKVIAIVPHSFAPSGQSEKGTVILREAAAPLSRIKLVNQKVKDHENVDITSARVLVAVGQGLNSQNDLGSIVKLAQALGGEVGCSKPVATDKKWLSEDRVIGLSGKTCKPELAILMGISGQVQFIVGIRDAGTIVAVNSDENAPINQMADYILTSDLHPVVEAFLKSI